MHRDFFYLTKFCMCRLYRLNHENLEMRINIANEKIQNIGLFINLINKH